MASYLKSIFWSRDSSSTSKSNSRRFGPLGSSNKTRNSKPPAQSESPAASSPTKAKHLNYLYSEAPSVPSTAIQPTTRERSNSLIASRTIAPSPLRYSIDSHTNREAHGVHPQVPDNHRTHSLDGGGSKVPLYRSSSHKVERPSLMNQPAFNTTNSFGSVRSSDQSIHSTNPSVHRYAPSRNSSSGSVTTQSTTHEPRSVLKNSRDNSRNARHAHVSFQNPNRFIQVHMHPLLSCGRLHRAPISFNIVYPPSSRTVVDRHTHTPIPSYTLIQPATEPPTYGRFVLKCDKLLWDIIATPGMDTCSSGLSGSANRAPEKRFYIGSTPSSSSSSGRPRSSSSSSATCEAITNLDVLQAIHTTLSTRVTQAEWDSLGSGSRVQRKVTRAYEKRCTDMGGGWGAGVRRVDFLGGMTKLVGIEVVTEKVANGDPLTTGKLVFARP